MFGCNDLFSSGNKLPYSTLPTCKSIALTCINRESVQSEISDSANRLSEKNAAARNGPKDNDPRDTAEKKQQRSNQLLDSRAKPLHKFLASGLAIHPVTGHVYFGLQEKLREIWRVSPAGGSPEVFASGFRGRLQDLTFSPDGKSLFVSDKGRILQITGPFHEELQR